MTAEAWIAGAALLVAIAAFVVSISSAKSARRSADAAEKANELALPGVGRDGVRWIIEPFSRDGYQLRNVGSVRADGVTIRESDVPCVTSDLPDGISLGPGEGARFLMLGTFGGPIPAHLPVRWAGSDEPVSVPVPA
jgi:hypothetical protein